MRCCDPLVAVMCPHVDESISHYLLQHGSLSASVAIVTVSLPVGQFPVEKKN